MPDYATPCKVPTGFDLGKDEPTGSSYWVEKIDNESPASGEWSNRYARTTLYAWIPDSEVGMYNFTNAVLGYTYTTADRKLWRVNPIAHPKYNGLYAQKITSCTGISYEQKADGSPPPAQANSLRKFAQYRKNLVSVDFAPPRYNIREDTDPQISGTGSSIGEFQRNVDYDTTSNIYDVTIQTGQFGFAEGAAGAPGPPNAKTFPGELNFFEVKTTFSLRWRLLPQDFVYDTLNYPVFPYPTKVGGAVGRVNSADIWGYSKGTLLLLEPEIDRYVSGTLRNSDGRTPLFMCDVTYPIIHFNPPSYGSTYKGHNLKPWWKTGDTTITYYLVTSDKTTTGIRIYGEYDFSKLFTHWSL